MVQGAEQVSAKPRFVGFTGTLRDGAHTGAILASLVPALADRVELEILSLASIPLYNSDLDGDAPPEPVRAFKQAIGAARGVIIVTAEYNYSIPGVLKNALDWTSRPAFNSVFKNKPLLAVTASPGALGGVRAHAHLRDILVGSMFARPVPMPEIVITAANTKIQNGTFSEPGAFKLIGDAVDLMLRMS
jgi:chromate reductase